MSLFLRTIQSNDMKEIFEFEDKKLRESLADEADRAITSWSAPWRTESLEHYIASGWSFLARDQERNSKNSSEGELVGYFLAQPLLFFGGQTQSLWVEHLQFSTLQARDELCDLAYKLGREKHIQRVYFQSTSLLAPTLKAMKAMDWNSQTVFIKTTKVD